MQIRGCPDAKAYLPLRISFYVFWQKKYSLRHDTKVYSDSDQFLVDGEVP